MGSSWHRWCTEITRRGETLRSVPVQGVPMGAHLIGKAGPMPRRESVRLAAIAPRQRRHHALLPPEVGAQVRRSMAGEDANGDWTEAARLRKAPLDVYLARLYVLGGWPSGALREAMGVASRETVARRVRRGRALGLDSIPEVSTWPLPSGPENRS